MKPYEQYAHSYALFWRIHQTRINFVSNARAHQASQRVFSGGDDTVFTGQLEAALELPEETRRHGLVTGLLDVSSASRHFILEFSGFTLYVDGEWQLMRPFEPQSAAGNRARNLFLQSLGLSAVVVGGTRITQNRLEAFMRWLLVSPTFLTFDRNPDAHGVGLQESRRL